MSAFIATVIGKSWLSRIGSALLLVGILLLAYSGGAYVGWFPGGYTSVPAPEALSAGQRSARLEQPETSLRVEVVPTLVPSESPQLPAAVSSATVIDVVPTTVPTSVPIPSPVAAVSPSPVEVANRVATETAPRPGVPVRLVLDSIGVDTEVKSGGLKPNQNGELEWETLPFVAVNYQQLGPVGKTGNPVIAGHVVTRFEGNVFRDLYKVELGAPIEVYTDGSRFEYQVDEVKLVDPSSIEVMAPTTDARLTLITCGGTFDPRSRTFSDRLIVVGKLVGGERL